MLTVPTALLLHRTADGSHHDWLLGTPDYLQAPDTRLWTARVVPPSRHWRGLGSFGLTVIAPHRRAYLDYQGTISGGRGSVIRIDRGTAVIRLWSSGRIVWDVRMRDFTGTIEAKKLAGNNWGAAVVL